MKEKIIDLVEQFNDPVNTFNTMKERQDFLQSLVETHGVDDVAIAAGLSVSTLQIYLRSKRPNIGEKPIIQATWVFGQLEL